MTPEQWRTIGEVFEQAVLLPAGARTAVVDRACEFDEEVRGEVASLLASHQAAGGFLQDRLRDAFVTFLETSTAGEPGRAGPYRLVRELGRGGMGSVFLAERDDDQYQARVAVKLVRPGMDTEFILDRFRRERQTLARLQHPNICRLLDGGATDSGLPYIVMEYIDGRWLTDYARERALDVRARIRLFIDVCSAVGYAHRHFIIHRDLKPGNILVDADGVPKLLDFGICKLLRSDEIVGDETADIRLTPNYASPEQLRGGAATPLSDVWALGAVLYELLTGKSPRSFDRQSWGALEQILNTPIPPPSAAVDNRQTARLLAGDLDNVLMRALDADPERRYESVVQLAEDLRRFLDHEPVQARRPSFGYRSGKFLRRHRLASSVSALAVAALAGGLALFAYEARVARASQEQTRALSNKLVFDLFDAVRDLPGATRASKMLLQTGLEYLDSSTRATRGDAQAERELATAYRKLGDVQGNARIQNLGDPASALVSYRKALALLDSAARRAPSDPEAARERLTLHSRVAAVQMSTGKLPDALETLEAGIKAGTGFANSGNPELLAALANLYMDASETRRNMSDYTGALPEALESVRILRAVVAERPSDPEQRHALATAFASVGMAETTLNQLAPALEHYRQGTAEMEKLVAADPNNAAWSRDLMLAYGHIGDVLGYPDVQNLGDRNGALDAYRKAARIGEALHKADAADLRAVMDLGIVLSRLEKTMDDSDWQAKRTVQEQSLRVLDAAARISPNDTTIQLYQCLVRQHLGDVLMRGADLEGARAAFGASATVAENGLKTGHRAFGAILLGTLKRLAVNAASRGQRAEALDTARRALSTGEELFSAKPPAIAARSRGLATMGYTYAALVKTRVGQPGDRADAVSWLEKAVDAWHAIQSDPTFGSPLRAEMREAEEMLAAMRASG